MSEKEQSESQKRFSITEEEWEKIDWKFAALERDRDNWQARCLESRETIKILLGERNDSSKKNEENGKTS